MDYEQDARGLLQTVEGQEMNSGVKVVVKERHWLFAILIAFLIIVGPGTIEGNLHPCCSPAEITKTEISMNQDDTLFWGTAARLRPECNFVRLEGFLGERQRRYVPITVILGKPKVRPDGEFTFGPWIAKGITPKQLRENTFMDVYHQCFIFGFPVPWLVKSHFYR